MPAITIEVHDQAVQEALAALARRICNIGTALEMVGEEMVKRIDRRFETESGPDGVKWEKLKPATRRRKRGTKILTESGDLRGSIVPQVAGAALTLGAYEPYAAIHQFGGTIQRQAGQVTVRHRTTAGGELLRSEIMGGRGLVFAKAGHKRALTRSFAHAAYAMRIPPRPYFPVESDGSLYGEEQRALVARLERWLAAGRWADRGTSNAIGEADRRRRALSAER